MSFNRVAVWVPKRCEFRDEPYSSHGPVGRQIGRSPRRYCMRVSLNVLKWRTVGGYRGARSIGELIVRSESGRASGFIALDVTSP
jgi:hypothetical protein